MSHPLAPPHENFNIPNPETSMDTLLLHYYTVLTS